MSGYKYTETQEGVFINNADFLINKGFKDQSPALKVIGIRGHRGGTERIRHTLVLMSTGDSLLIFAFLYAYIYYYILQFALSGNVSYLLKVTQSLSAFIIIPAFAPLRLVKETDVL